MVHRNVFFRIKKGNTVGLMNHSIVREPDLESCLAPLGKIMMPLEVLFLQEHFFSFLFPLCC